MRKSLFFAIIALCLVSIVSYAAKPENTKVNNDEKVKTIKTEPKKVADKAKVDTTSKKIVQKSPEQIKIDDLRDSLRRANDSILFLNNKLSLMKDTLVQRMKFADDIAVRLAYLRLERRYDADLVGKAVEELNNIYTPEIKAKYQVIIKLLSNYGQYNQEILFIVSEAQNDRNRKSPQTEADAQKFIQDFTSKLKASEYYRKYYSQKVVTIAYLNEIIDGIMKDLQKHSLTSHVDLSEYANRL